MLALNNINQSTPIDIDGEFDRQPGRQLLEDAHDDEQRPPLRVDDHEQHATNNLAYWKFDEASGNATDATNNSLTLTNNGTATFGAGLINNGKNLALQILSISTEQNIGHLGRR